MGLVCRVVEESGISTVCVSTGRDLTVQVKPPRSVFVNHPMGNPFGSPGDTDMQRSVLMAALDLVRTADTGGALLDLPFEWPEDFSPHFA